MASAGRAVSLRDAEEEPRAGLDEPWAALRAAYQLLRHRKAELAARFDLSLQEFQLLDRCARSPAMPSELARDLGVTPAGATDLIDRLEQRRLVARLEHPGDRRAVLVRPTAEGVRLHHVTRSAERTMVRRLLRELDANDLRALVQGLSALTRVLDAPRA